MRGICLRRGDGGARRGHAAGDALGGTQVPVRLAGGTRLAHLARRRRRDGAGYPSASWARRPGGLCSARPGGCARRGVRREFAEFARRAGGAAGSLIWRVTPDLAVADAPEEHFLGAGFLRRRSGGEYGGIQPRLVFWRHLGTGLRLTGGLGRHVRRTFAAGTEVRSEGLAGLTELFRRLQDTARCQRLVLRGRACYAALLELLGRVRSAPPSSPGSAAARRICRVRARRMRGTCSRPTACRTRSSAGNRRASMNTTCAGPTPPLQAPVRRGGQAGGTCRCASTTGSGAASSPFVRGFSGGARVAVQRGRQVSIAVRGN